MSFGYSVGDVLAIIALANKIRKGFIGAPEQYKCINQDVRSLSIVIQDGYANLDHMSEEQATNFNEILATCQTLLQKLESILSKWSVISDTSKSKTAQRLWERLRWEPDEIIDLRTQITSKITLLNAFNDQATSHNVAKLVRRNDNDEEQAMLDWISSIDYIPQQNHLVSRLQPNSRKWLFDSAEYQNWETQRGQVLFCPGDPGTGKTFTAAIVLETLQEQTRDNPDVLNTFVYCTYQAPDQDARGLISSLLRNSLQQAMSIPEAIFSKCHRKRSANQSLLRDEGLKHLETLYGSFERVNLVVDALDEIPTEVSRPFITDILKLQKICELNLLVTSRRIPEILNQFTAHGAAILEIRGSDKDIRQFLNDSIFQLPQFVARDETFQAEIIERITEASSGVFLLAELHLRSLKNKKSRRALRTSLDKLAVGSDAYDDAYQDAMTRIAGLGPESEALAKQALLILISAREPLGTEDLAYALSIEPDSETIDDENVPDIEDVAGVCAGLMIVDKESNIVRLVHKSAHEYFERHQAQLFPCASDTMARLCIKYLDLASSKSGFCKSDESSRPPFWSYANMNWAYHLRCAEEDNEVIKETDVNEGSNIMVSNLHSVSTLAIDLIARDKAGSLPSALEKACQEGRHGLVELLLTVNNYDLNRQPQGSSTARIRPDYDTWSEEGMTSNMEQGDDSRYSSDANERASWQSSESSESCGSSQVRERRKSDIYLQNGLFLIIKASNNGDEAMVGVLINQGADPSLVSTSGLTALYVAAENGHENIVSLLLEQPKIDPDYKVDDWTPLLVAASRGHSRCVKILLDHAKRNYRDRRGNNAACLAAKAGQVEVLKELIQWSDVELDSAAGNKHRSALEMALRGGNSQSALLIIPLSDVSRMYRHGDRPLHLATRAGCLEAVRLLLTRGVHINAKDKRGKTALHVACSIKNRQTIETILKHPDTDINICDNDGNTPLIDLVLQGSNIDQDDMLLSVNMLLSRLEMDINVQNRYGNTALLMAASQDDNFDIDKDDDIFNALFYHNDVDRKHKNRFGQTILTRAIMAGSRRVHTIVKETELSHQFNDVDAEGNTLLSLAARHEWNGKLKWEDIVDMSPPDVINLKNSQGKTPIEVHNTECKSLYIRYKSLGSFSFSVRRRYSRERTRRYSRESSRSFSPSSSYSGA